MPKIESGIDVRAGSQVALAEGPGVRRLAGRAGHRDGEGDLVLLQGREQGLVNSSAGGPDASRRGARQQQRTSQLCPKLSPADFRHSYVISRMYAGN